MILIKGINSVTSGSKNKFFDLVILKDDNTILSNAIYVADIDVNNDIIDRSKKSNTLNFMTTSESGSLHLVHNMYSSKDVYWKSAIYGVSKTTRTNSTFDFQNIFLHLLSAELTNAIEVDNTIYILGEKTNIGHMNISTDILQYISCDNGMFVPDSVQILTIIYNRAYIENCLANDIKIDPISAVLTKLNNIQYNTIYEIPGQIQNDYQSSNIAANTFKIKNQYDATYNMCHDNETVLSNARDYIGIGKCGDQVFLKYYDCISYDKMQNQNYNLEGKNGFKYLHIETLGAVNRFTNAAGHKTNLYSIVVKTDMLEKFKGNILQTMKYEMQNTIRSIAEALAPAHTQLFKVYVNGN